MYTPRSFREENTTVLHDLMRRYNFATLFTWTDDGSVATHLPFILEADKGPHGTLVAHMARANRHWRSLGQDHESLVVFVGPHAYISPSWYEQPNDVPTWNYAAVHVYGIPEVTEDPEVLRRQVIHLAATHEAGMSIPWDPKHVQEDIDNLLKAIVGIEIRIDRVEGTFKFNQNRSARDRAGVVAALEASPDSLDNEVANIMRRTLEPAAR